MNKTESLQLKGIAIILMFAHHLLGCGTFLVLEQNLPVMLMEEWTKYLWAGGNLCIAIFAMVSGYGLYVSYINKENQKIWGRMIRFAVTYWTILFLVAIPYLILHHKFEPKYLLINLFALLHNDNMLYVSFSWYVKAYFEILLILPLVKKLSKRINSIEVEIALFLIAPLVLSLFLPNAEKEYQGIKIMIGSSLNLLCRIYPLFHVGVLVAKYRLFDRLGTSECKWWLRIGKIGLMTCLMIAALYYKACNRFAEYTEVVCLVLFAMAFVVIIRQNKWQWPQKVLQFLGEYSFQYWLLSGMFFINTTEYQWILFLPRISVLIVIWNFLFLAPGAVLMKKISDKILTFCR